MGALHVDKLVHIHQAWRLFTSMWLHHGVIDLVLNILLLLIIGIPLEKKFGFGKVLVIGVWFLLCANFEYDNCFTCFF